MSAMPPSIAIATPVLGGPGTMRVVLSSSSKPQHRHAPIPKFVSKWIFFRKVM